MGKLWRINLVRHSMASHQPGFIAVGIEPLLMIFKFALKSDSEHIIKAIWIIITAALLPVSTGVYVYSGSKAEGMRVNDRDKQKSG